MHLVVHTLIWSTRTLPAPTWCILRSNCTNFVIYNVIRQRSTRWTVYAPSNIYLRVTYRTASPPLHWGTWTVEQHHMICCAVMFSSSVVWWLHDLMIAWYVANVLLLHIFRIVCCIFTAQQRCATWTHFIDDDTAWLRMCYVCTFFVSRCWSEQHVESVQHAAHFIHDVFVNFSSP